MFETAPFFFVYTLYIGTNSEGNKEVVTWNQTKTAIPAFCIGFDRENMPRCFYFPIRVIHSYVTCSVNQNHGPADGYVSVVSWRWNDRDVKGRFWFGVPLLE